MSNWWFQTVIIHKWELVLLFVILCLFGIALLTFENLWLSERRRNKKLLLPRMDKTKVASNITDKDSSNNQPHT